MHKNVSRNDHEFTCDYGQSPSCRGEETIEDKDFMAAIAELKALGWQVLHILGAWEHHCPECKEHKKTKAFDKFKEKAREQE